MLRILEWRVSTLPGEVVSGWVGGWVVTACEVDTRVVWCLLVCALFPVLWRGVQAGNRQRCWWQADSTIFCLPAFNFDEILHCGEAMVQCLGYSTHSAELLSPPHCIHRPLEGVSTMVHARCIQWGRAKIEAQAMIMSALHRTKIVHQSSPRKPQCTAKALLCVLRLCFPCPFDNC